ncbi:helix-turn-helix domain-containing protein [Saccharopolyspora shandongensis]|uniref:helix-turn-helix domain-containing protein n=1 Tax=Saccharopolyspora shandongensis TaxID=418495 RepID=UPI0033F15EA6
MEVEWPPAREPAGQRVWREVLRPVAVEMTASADDLAQRAVARMHAECPELFPDAQTVEENLVSTEASLRQLAQIIELAKDPRRVELPPSTLAIARSGVQRRIPPAKLMRFYRLGQEHVWQWMLARITACSRSTAEQATAIELATGWLFAYTDGAMQRAEQAYETERDAWLRGAAAARAAAIEAILAGRERDHQRASTRLRYNVNRHHLGVIAWAESAPEDGDAQPPLSAALTALAQTITAKTTLIHPLGSLAVAGWLSWGRDFTADDIAAAQRADRPLDLPPGVRVAVGEPGQGLDGFRRTHIEAIHARRVASLIGPHADTLTHYRNVAVAALGTADPELALSFITTVLGSLADNDKTTRRIQTTLSAYLEENRSRNRTADRLSVHPNTVSYRVHQAEGTPRSQRRHRHPRSPGGPGHAAHTARPGPTPAARTVMRTQFTLRILSRSAERM